MVCGYEAMVRVSRASGFLAHRQKGWHATATLGAFGPPRPARSCWGWTGQGMVQALALAGSRTGGTWAFKADGSMSKRLHPGLAARDGLTAASLAAAGSPGRNSSWRRRTAGCSGWRAKAGTMAELVRGWGGTFAVTEIEFKWYAACKSVHAPLEAAAGHPQALRAPAEEVAAVDVGINSSAMAMAGGMYRRDSVASAQLSIPYGVALGLAGRGRAGRGFRARARSGTKACSSWPRKVRVAVSPGHGGDPPGASTRAPPGWRCCTGTAPGRSEEVHDARGHLGNPLDAAAVVEKFLGLAAGFPAREIASCPGRRRRQPPATTFSQARHPRRRRPWRPSQGGFFERTQGSMHPVVVADYSRRRMGNLGASSGYLLRVMSAHAVMLGQRAGSSPAGRGGAGRDPVPLGGRRRDPAGAPGPGPGGPLHQHGAPAGPELGAEVSGHLPVARSRNDVEASMWRIELREKLAALAEESAQARGDPRRPGRGHAPRP